MIVFTVSQAAIVVIKKAGKIGKARTRELRKVMRKIEEGKRVLGASAVSLSWVESHIGIKGNEEADKKAKRGVNKRTLLLL